MVSEVFCMDCMEYMRTMPDKFFDLAIVDPPYGIGRSCMGEKKKWKSYKPKDWDKSSPDRRYFEELFRVSENQIIFGGNYFTPYLPPRMGWIVWDKGQKLRMSDGELIYTSFNKALRIVTVHHALGLDFWGCEKDGEYFESQENRFLKQCRTRLDFQWNEK